MSSPKCCAASCDCTLKGLTIGAVNCIFTLAWMSETSLSYTLISTMIVVLIGIAALQKFSQIESKYDDLLSTVMNEECIKCLHRTLYVKINYSLNFLRSVMMMKCIWRTIGTILSLALIVTLFSCSSNLVCFWLLTNVVLAAPLVKIPDDVKAKICTICEKLNGELEQVLSRIPSYSQIERMNKYKVSEEKEDSKQ